jgi:hypothetical protein
MDISREQHQIGVRAGANVIGKHNRTKFQVQIGEHVRAHDKTVARIRRMISIPHA